MLMPQPAYNGYGMPSQDATGTAAPEDPLKTLIAHYIATAQAKQAAAMKTKAQLAPKPALTPAQILALIQAFKAAKPVASDTTGTPTTDATSALVAKIREIIAAHQVAKATVVPSNTAQDTTSK